MTASAETLGDAELERELGDPRSRRTNYRVLIPAYYARVTESYRATWGDSFHFGIFRDDDDSRAAAIAALELQVGRDAALAPGMRVLDVGCGIGGPALTIAETFGVHVTGVDLVQGHVELARDRALERGLQDQVDFFCADASELPFARGAFDAVYAFESGCHMPNKQQFYRECARVLRTGGTFLGTDWLSSGEHADPDGFLEGVCRFHALPDLIDPATLRRHLEAAGLVVDLIDVPIDTWQIFRHWAALDVQPPPGLPGASAAAGRLLSAGGRALAAASEAGLFLVCRWRSHKPELQ